LGRGPAAAPIGCSCTEEREFLEFTRVPRVYKSSSSLQEFLEFTRVPMSEREGDEEGVKSRWQHGIVGGKQYRGEGRNFGLNSGPHRVGLNSGPHRVADPSECHHSERSGSGSIFLEKAKGLTEVGRYLQYHGFGHRPSTNIVFSSSGCLN
jgi:hypothetical protein